jgi:hypothetical protein
MDRIDAETFSKAEKILAVRGELGGMQAVHETAAVDSDAVARIVQHHVKGTLSISVPDLDPRAEPSINTLCAHFLMVGVVSERIRSGLERIPE